MLNLFQHLTASLYLPPPFLGEILKQFRMTFGGSCYFYTHFGEANSILMKNSLIVAWLTLRAAFGE